MEDNKEKTMEQTKDFAYFMILKEVEKFKEEMAKNTVTQINGFINEFRGSIGHHTKEINNIFEELRSITNSVRPAQTNSTLMDHSMAIGDLREKIGALQSDVCDLQDKIISKEDIMDPVREILLGLLRPPIKPDSEKISIDVLKLPPRVFRPLIRSGYDYVEDIEAAINDGSINKVNRLGELCQRLLKGAIFRFRKGL